MCRHYQAIAGAGAAGAVAAAWALETHRAVVETTLVAIGGSLALAIALVFTAVFRSLHREHRLLEHEHTHPAHVRKRAGPSEEKSWPHRETWEAVRSHDRSA